LGLFDVAAVQATNNRSGKSSFFILDNIIEVCFSLLSCVFVKYVVESYIKIRGIDHCFLSYHLSRQYLFLTLRGVQFGIYSVGRLVGTDKSQCLFHLTEGSRVIIEDEEHISTSARVVPKETLKKIRQELQNIYSGMSSGVFNESELSSSFLMSPQKKE
jgi:hypothetical protein